MSFEDPYQSNSGEKTEPYIKGYGKELPLPAEDDLSTLNTATLDIGSSSREIVHNPNEEGIVDNANEEATINEATVNEDTEDQLEQLRRSIRGDGDTGEGGEHNAGVYDSKEVFNQVIKNLKIKGDEILKNIGLQDILNKENLTLPEILQIQDFIDKANEFLSKEEINYRRQKYFLIKEKKIMLTDNMGNYDETDNNHISVGLKIGGKEIYIPFAELKEGIPVLLEDEIEKFNEKV